MAGISDFVAQAASKLGVSTDAAGAATGGLGALIKQHAGAADFGKLAGALPGLGDLVAKAGGGGGGGGGGGLGGMLGGLAAKAGGLLGGGGGAAAGALAAVTASGISPDKAGGFLSMFADFAKKNVSPELLKSVLGKVPGLSGLVG